MNVYQSTFAALVLINSFLTYHQYKREEDTQLLKEAESEAQINDSLKRAATRFKLHYLPVFALVMASDWLQGPYIYTLYRDEKRFSEETVAALFTTGFVSAAISASFVGRLADKHGRRTACLFFCAVYMISSLTAISNNILILFLGRVLGGFGTTLIYSVFESWMVTEYFKQNLDKGLLTLSSMFGIIHTFNSVVAIVCGVVGEFLVKYSASKTAPFLASALLLWPASMLMKANWNENYGESVSAPEIQETRKSGFKIVWQNKPILVLGLTSACFEGTMYLFVFFWSAAIKSSRTLSLATTTEPGTKSNFDKLAAETLPFGIIFSTFMAAMMAGSILFSFATSGRNVVSLAPGYLLTISIAGASTSLLLTVMYKGEQVTFWCFAMFEFCIGIYFPSMGYAKGKIVEDADRAHVYGILRIPLNLFVVVALSITVEGERHRDDVFLFCGGILVMAAVASSQILQEK